MAEQHYTISAAAEEIQISRPTLYKYLDKPKYKPKIVAGHPVLTSTQVEAIKAERANGKETNAKT